MEQQRFISLQSIAAAKICAMQKVVFRFATPRPNPQKKHETPALNGLVGMMKDRAGRGSIISQSRIRAG